MGRIIQKTSRLEDLGSSSSPAQARQLTSSALEKVTKFCKVPFFCG